MFSLTPVAVFGLISVEGIECERLYTVPFSSFFFVSCYILPSFFTSMLNNPPGLVHPSTKKEIGNAFADIKKSLAVNYVRKHKENGGNSINDLVYRETEVKHKFAVFAEVEQSSKNSALFNLNRLFLI